MIDYYKEFNLKRNASAKEISDELIRLEAVWNKREMSQPEMAMEKLSLINKAKKIFSTDGSKAEYDMKLDEESAKPKKSNEELQAQFQKFYDDAVNFMANGQYDLAKAALERAASYGVDKTNAKYYYTAAIIYRNNKELITAFSNINQAIVLNPDDPEFYLEKSLIVDGLRVSNTGQKAKEYKELAIRSAEQALYKATIQHNDPARGRALGLIAWIEYFLNSNDSLGDDYAKKALEYGDSWGNAKKVSDSLAKKRAEAERIRKENELKRAESEKRQQEQEAAKQRADEENKKRDERNAAIEKQANSFYFGGWLGLALTFLIGIASTSGSPIALFMKTAILLASIGLLFYGESYGNGYTTRLIQSITAGATVGFLLLTGTRLYTYLGFSRESAGTTWKFVFFVLALILVEVFVASRMGKNARNHK